MKVLFMGTPEFAVPSLRAIIDSGFDVAGVVTVPDMPAGRGLKLKMSPVKTFAIDNNLQVLQPENLGDVLFLKQVKELNPDVAVVVAFRKLPTELWKIPTLGTFNLHASLLPQYRGAAPMNHAIINGEKITGLTTFFINEGIDTGNIIHTIDIQIEDNDTIGTLHDKMCVTGAHLVVKTLKDIQNNTVNAVSQDEIIVKYGLTDLKKAPRIFKTHCLIDWDQGGEEIRNLIRGLSPYPGAYGVMTHSSGKSFSVKLFDAEFCPEHSGMIAGNVLFFGGKMIVGTGDSHCLFISQVQPESRPKMTVSAMLNGMQEKEGWKFEV
jgi:methionyl-tRNA formyltransferase